MALFRKISPGFFAAWLVALGFPPVSFWPLCFLGFIIFALPLLASETPPQNSPALARSYFFHFYAYSFFVNLLGFYWIGYTFHEFGNLSWIAAAAIALLGFLVFALPSGFFGWLWYQIAKRLPNARQRAIALVPFLIVWDWIDFRVFPWTPAMGVGSDPLLLASVFYLKTWGWRILFFAVTTLAAFAYLESGKCLRSARFLKLGLAPLIALLVVGYGLGAASMAHLKRTHPARQPVALLQGNVGNYEKKLTKLGVAPTIRNVMNIHQDLIEKVALYYSKASTDENKEVWMAWPETSFPGWPISEMRSDLDLRDWSHLIRGSQFVGGYETGEIPFGSGTKEVDFNIVAFYQEQSGLVDHYRKRIRLAFGEYIPGDIYFPWLYEWIPAVNHFGKGEVFVPLAHPDPTGPVFIPLVCYEILYEGFVADFVKEARAKYPGRELVIVNATNDSWYGPTSELYQHSLMARWAMVAEGLPGLRPTNTGLSQVIAPWGEVVATVDRNESLVAFGELPVEKVQQRLPPVAR